MRPLPGLLVAGLRIRLCVTCLFAAIQIINVLQYMVAQVLQVRAVGYYNVTAGSLSR